MPQASVEPLFTKLELVEPIPEAFSQTVTFWQSAFGLTVSKTVTAAVQLFKFELRSVTVKVTKFGPAIFAQVKVESFRLKDRIPHASLGTVIHSGCRCIACT